MNNKRVIRTSDRQSFKKCRRAWDWGSKIRQNYEPLTAAKPLEFGTAIHKALEVYYDPDLWPHDPEREVAQALAIAAFVQITKEHKQQYIRVRDGDLDVEVANDFEERLVLGTGMLRNYFSWAPKYDNFTPLRVEVEFEVPIVGLRDVVYQGRVDLLLEDTFGQYWICDHKTAAQFGDTSHLVLDEQCGSYCWALQQELKLPIAGVIYNELKKAAPHPPAALVRGGFSKNKMQDTTYELYVQTLMDEYGAIPAEYEEFVEYLKDQPNKFFRRTQVHRSQTELQNLGRQITLEATDMLSDPLIYPNPVKWNCGGCAYRQLCVAQNDGSDVQFLVEAGYKKRDSN